MEAILGGQPPPDRPGAAPHVSPYGNRGSKSSPRRLPISRQISRAREREGERERARERRRRDGGGGGGVGVGVGDAEAWSRAASLRACARARAAWDRFDYIDILISRVPEAVGGVTAGSAR